MNLRRERRRRRRAAAGIHIGSWNTKNASKGRLKRYVRSQLRAGASAIVLTEVWRRHPELRAIARRYGLRMLAETPEPGGRDPGRALVSEHGDTVVLLAPDFVLESWDVIELDERWYVDTAGRWHAPRRLIVVRGHVRGQRVELLAVHGPTNNRWNRAAVAEFKRVVERIVTNTGPNTISAAVGDFNVRLPDAEPWAAVHDLHTSGRGPDIVLANRRTTSKTGRRRRSDHYDVLHRLDTAA